jgi:hypothetical protein
MMKKKWMIAAVLMILFVLYSTNPTKQDYEAIYLQGVVESNEKFEKYYELERINFIFFSTYTPFIAHENGITHLGVLGHFFPITDGPFDYPNWLEFFK